MCNQKIKKDKENLLSSPEYPVIYGRVAGILREEGLKSELPGYQFIIQACCTRAILNYEEKDIQKFLEMGLVPKVQEQTKIEFLAERGLLSKNKQWSDEELRRLGFIPVDQWMKESLRAAGIKDSPYKFINKICKYLKK